jgi:putative membrane protein
MYWYNTGWGWSFFGMSMLWWVFWIALIGLFFALATPQPRRRVQDVSALELLARRFAAGEIDADEYERRRERLMRDYDAGVLQSRSRPPATTTTTTQPPLPST